MELIKTQIETYLLANLNNLSKEEEEEIWNDICEYECCFTKFDDVSSNYLLENLSFKKHEDS